MKYQITWAMLNKQPKHRFNLVATLIIVSMCTILFVRNFNREPALEAEMICNEVNGSIFTPTSSPATVDYTGVASWYDYSLNGQEWSKTHRTCASRTLPRYSTAIVTNLENGKSVECFVNDYIEHPDREIDLSSYAFSQIADLSRGLVNVKIELK